MSGQQLRHDAHGKANHILHQWLAQLRIRTQRIRSPTGEKETDHRKQHADQQRHRQIKRENAAGLLHFAPPHIPAAQHRCTSQEH